MILKGFHGLVVGWLLGWFAELLVVLGLLGFLERMFGFLVLLEGGLNHVVPTFDARRCRQISDY